MSGLRAAAAALIAEAPESTVLAVLRMLIDELTMACIPAIRPTVRLAPEIRSLAR